jgi:hypothetical protein
MGRDDIVLSNKKKKGDIAQAKNDSISTLGPVAVLFHDRW